MGDAAPLAASREDGPVVRGRQSPDSLLPISGSAPNHTGSPGPVSGRGAGGEGQIDPSSHFQFASSNSPHTVPYYITASRLVSQKRIDLVVEAFTQTPGRELIVIGDGPERKRLEAMATPNVRILGHLPEHQMIHWMQHADAFVFAAEEDFGIVPVEAMACGTPVIALGRGGTRETVIDGETGVFFQDQSPESLLHAIQRFESQSWDADLCVRQAQQFTAAQFRDQLRNVCHQQLASSS
ncbi:MAG: glycosyltransferase [Planctomycetota bacterium]